MLLEIVDDGDVVIARGDQVHVRGRLDPTLAETVGDAGLARRTLLRRHEDDARGSLRAVDGAGRGILEDRDGFDVVGVEHGEAALDPVDQHERAAAVDGKCAADVDGGGTVGAAVARGDVHGRVRALEGIGRGDDGTLVERRTVDDADGARQRAFLLGAEADDHHLVEDVFRVVEDDVVRNGLVAGQVDFRIGVSDVGNDDAGREADAADFIPAVGVRDESGLRAGDLDGRPRKRVSARVGNFSVQGPLRLRRQKESRPEQQEQDEFFHIAYVCILSLRTGKNTDKPMPSQDGPCIIKVSIKDFK